MSAFALGVIASIIGSAVFALVSAYFASRFRKQVTAALSALLGTGVEAVYSNEEEAASDLVRYSRASQTVCILNMRAFSLLDERRPLHFLLRPDQRVDRTVRILISDPNSPAVDARAGEISAVEPTYNLDRYRANITDSVRVLTGLARGNS